jgi:hypothetical protein
MGLYAKYGATHSDSGGKAPLALLVGPLPWPLALGLRLEGHDGHRPPHPS